MFTKVRKTIFVILLGILCFGLTGLWIKADAATIKIEPSTFDLAVGEKKIVKIVVDGIDGNGLAAFQFALFFNPNLL